MKKYLSLILVLALSAALLIGCAAPVQTAASEETAPVQSVLQPQVLTGGVLCLKINPEIALHYDENGKVTRLEGRNSDGTQLLKDFTGFEGKDTAQVLEELVKVIGQAGYFVEEADGNARKIVLELDPGSQVPHEQFLEDMAVHVKQCVENKSWIGEKEYEYNEVTVPKETTVQSSTATDNAVKSSAPAQATPATNKNLCPVCADDDCDDGKYCDDADEKAENLREEENRKKGVSCEICGDYDCDDGKYCDDADEKAENLREEENRKKGIRCKTCGDYDCDDGKYCDGD